MKLLVVFSLIFYITTGRRNQQLRNSLSVDEKSYGRPNLQNHPDSRTYLRNDIKSGRDSKPQSTYKNDVAIAQRKAKVIKDARDRETRLNNYGPIFRGSHSAVFDHKSRYHRDPVLNYRRAVKNLADSSTSVSSSSREMKDWRDEFRQDWLQKKIEAMNHSKPMGDTVNMVAARPWGVQCGDPNQHDLPWGTCMLPMECEPEYRIYRGDAFCGRTQFVCCGLQVHAYDNYMGIDISLADSTFETDSNERKGKDVKKNKKRKRERKKRKKNRTKRKRELRKTIRKIQKQVRKMLIKYYRNGTRAKKKRTNQLKAFLKNLKKRYKKDRQGIRDIHDMDMIKIDAALMARLQKIGEVNREFGRNATFREWVTKHTMTKQQARMLVQSYPDLASFFIRRRSEGPSRRPDYLDYDIEYGMVYY